MTLANQFVLGSLTSFIGSNNATILDFRQYRPFYGRITTDGYPIIVRTDKLVLLDDVALYVLPFVAEHYAAFRDDWARQLGAGRAVPSKQLFLGQKLQVKRAWVDFQQAYASSINMQYRRFAQRYGSDKQVRTFADFVLKFKAFVSSQPNLSLTLRQNILNANTSFLINGLTLELADMQFNAKMEAAELAKFYRDPNFSLYVDMAARHGFFVDFRAPWRLVFDIGSHLAPPNVLRDYYQETDYLELPRFKAAVAAFYNAFIGYAPTVTILAENCSPIWATDLPRQQNFPNYYSNAYWLELYISTRYAEQGQKPNSNVFFSAINLQKNIDSAVAVRYIDGQL